ETNANLDEVVALAKELQVIILHYHFSEVGVYAYAAAQVKKAIEATFLKAAADYKKKIGFNVVKYNDHFSCYVPGTLLIEPKPQEPTKHQYGGIAPGGFNFDAKLSRFELIAFFLGFRRRESTDVEDLFIAHISGMDTLARGLRNVVKLTEAGKADFETLEKKVMDWGEPSVPSGKQELAEMIFQSAL
ncbi:hypothetical protein BHE74_00009921, partial [Ensete ventricosum]